VILDNELEPVTKKVKISKPDGKHISVKSEFTQTHSAAFDAFMTGFIFAHQLMEEDIEQGRNRVYLIGKQLPLMVEKSRYTRVSKNHEQKRILFQ
jgi:target of EGR1 protein 1